MKHLLCLLALVALAVVPVRAGVSVSFHGGGGYGGYHGYSGGSYGGHGYYGGTTSGFHGYYGYRYRGIYPYYGYSSYSYAPVYDYSAYDYPIYSAPTVFTSSYDAPVYPYVTPAVPPPTPTTAPSPAVASAATPTGPVTGATGKLDDFGFIHSPFSTATFKADKIAPGQVFYDPITGQAFTVAKPEAPAVPSAAPSASLPVGKVDEFGYVHSPFSTFTFKVPSGNFAQVFRDPYTGQSFTIHPKAAPQNAVQTVAGPAGAAQASD